MSTSDKSDEVQEYLGEVRQATSDMEGASTQHLIAVARGPERPMILPGHEPKPASDAWRVD